MTKVTHLTDDLRAGGVMTNVRGMMNFEKELETTQHVVGVDPDNAWSARYFSTDVLVVHFSLAWRKLPFLFALRLLNREALFVLQEHHYSPEHFETKPRALKRFRTLARTGFRLFDRVLAVSNAQARWYASLDAKPHAVVSPLTNLDTLLSLPKKTKSQRIVIGISGRLEKEKGIDLLLSIIGLNANRRLHFLIAGDGELRTAVEKAARIFDNVTYFGTYDNPREFLANCNIVTIPSRLDTFGIAALEAKAAGKPIVVTQTCGLVEQAKDCGVVIEKNCSLSLLNGIQQLASDKRFDTLGNNARASAAGHIQSALDAWRQQLAQK